MGLAENFQATLDAARQAAPWAWSAIYEELAPGALEFARQLFETIDPADRAAFERAVACLTEQSRRLSDAAATETKPRDNEKP